MKWYIKMLIGGAGGIVPIILNLLTVDYKTVFMNLTILVALGYIIRVVLLFSIGGGYALLHNEKSKKKLFEIGVLAPALITSLINAGNANQAINRSQNTVDSSHHSLLVSVAYAHSNEESFENFSAYREGAVQQVWRGFTGSQPKDNWFVIVGSYNEPSTAKAEADKINSGQNSIKAKIIKDASSYKVVIGSELTHQEAEEIRKRAIDLGLSSEMYLFQLTP